LWCAGGARIVGFSPQAFQVGPVVSLAMLAIYGGLFFSVGFMEELMFRGYGLHNLRAWLGLPAAMVIQAVIFAAAHTGNEGMPTALSLYDGKWALVNLVLIAYFFALAYMKTGTLWFPIGFHAAWNWCLGCVWSLPVSGIPVFRMLDVTSSENTALSGGSFGAEGSLLLAPVILFMLWILRTMPDHPHATFDLQSLEPPYSDEIAPAGQPVVAPLESDWPEPDPDRQRRFKTSMKAEAAPEIAGAELDQLARELKASSARAAAQSATVLPAPALQAIPAEAAAALPDEIEHAPVAPLAAAVVETIVLPTVVTIEPTANEPMSTGATVEATAPMTSAEEAEPVVVAAKKPRW